MVSPTQRLLLFGLAIALPALCQIRSATISGKVTDPSDSAVAGARVRVVALDTNAAFETQTNSSGNYTAPYLAAGRYMIEVNASGFAPGQVKDVNVGTAQSVRADLQLQLQSVSTAVEVSANAVALQTESASVNNAVDVRLIQSTPNVTNNPFYFATLQAGLVPRANMNDSTTVNSFGIGVDGRRQFSAVSSNGGQAFTNDIQLDGVSIQGSGWNEAAVIPNRDGVQEVRVLTNSFSAEYGRAQGVLVVSTKSGTNQIHGSANYQMRNEFLNAAMFANNARAISKPSFKVNTFGGTLGGPVMKDRMFFFGSYEGMRHKEAVDYLRTVPTDLERKGDFSQTLVNVNGRGTPVRLFDPYTVVREGPDAFRRVPIPESRILRPDPYILKLYSFYPSPNRTPEDEYNTNNFLSRYPQTFSRNNINSRIDYRAGRHMIYGTGGAAIAKIRTPKSWGPDNPFHSRIAFIGNNVSDRNPYAGIGDTVALTPTVVMDFRYGVNRIAANNEAEVDPSFDYSAYGIPNDLLSLNAAPGAAIEFYPGGNWSQLNRTNSLHKRERQLNHHLVGSVTKIAGKWTLKFGSEHRAYFSNYSDPEESFQIRPLVAATRERVTADGSNLGSATNDVAGYGPASILLGAGDIYVAQGRGALPALAQKYYAFYMQNDWRATPKLTVNLGLRYEVQPGPTERFNRMMSFDGTASNPYGGAGAWAFPGTAGYSRNLWDTQWRNFGPRVGLAYQIRRDTVVRAGYGIMYLPTNTGYFGSGGLYGMDNFSGYTVNDYYGPEPAGRVVGRFYEVTRAVRAVGPDASYPRLYGQPDGNGRFDRRDYRNGSTQQWNLFVERMLPGEWVVSAGYAGSKADHLPYARMPQNSLQFLPDELLAQWRDSWIASNGAMNPATATVTNPFQPAGQPLIPFNGNLKNARISQTEALNRYPMFGSNGANNFPIQKTVGSSQYHSMQLNVKRSFRSGFQMMANYVWSKSTDMTQTEAQTNGFADTGGYVFNLDLRNFRNNRKISYTDVPHRAVFSYVYELPFGAGKPWLSGSSVLNWIAGGWQLGGTTTFQSGSPLQISSNAPSLNGLADRIPGVPIEVPKELQRWYDGKTTVTLPSGRQITPSAYTFLKYNIDAFQSRVVQAPNGNMIDDQFWWGNSAMTYNDMRGPGRNNWDLTVQKVFPLREGIRAELQGHFTNLFNHTQIRPSSANMNLGQANTRPNQALGVVAGSLANGSTFGTFPMGTSPQGTFDPRQITLELRIRF